jgi:hypothetical protein
MSADLLTIGDAEKGEDGGALLDVVDIAVDGRVEERAPDDLEDAHQHQDEDGNARDEVERGLEPPVPHVEPAEHRGRRLSFTIAHGGLTA